MFDIVIDTVPPLVTFSIADVYHAPEHSPRSENNNYVNTKLTSHKHSVRSLRSIVESSMRPAPPTSSWTKSKEKTTSTMWEQNTRGVQRKRMGKHHIAFMMPPHIDMSRSTGNVSVMIGKQLLLKCHIPNTGNESVS